MQFTPTQTRAAAWLLIAAVGCLVLLALGPVLTPFVVAAVLAYALTPLVNWLDHVGGSRLPRVLAVLLVQCLFMLAVLGVVLLIVPVLVKELPLLREQVPLLLDRLNASLQPWLVQMGVGISLDLASLKSWAREFLSTNTEEILNPLLTSLKLGGSVALAVLGNVVLIPVALFYLLMDWERLVARTLSFVPPRLRGGVDHFLAEADAVLGQYLRGQLLVMLAMALFYSVGLLAFGLDLAIPIGLFTGLAMFVPYLGFGVGLLLALLAGLLQFAPAKALLMVGVVYGAGQVLESLFLTPRLVGERIGLHPLAVIFALLAFGQMFGFVGVLVALPVSAVMLVALRRARDHYLASKLYSG